ncbi:MAG: hypothetical protein LBG22_06370, partial [Treponema sp.]|nr:hypothetical protein [Treponema sp.]
MRFILKNKDNNMYFSCDFSWGEWTGYFGKSYMPQYDFSGGIYVEKGEITSIRRIEFPYDDWGPFILSRRYLPVGDTSFTSHIHNWFEGMRICGSGTEDTILGLETKMGTLRFTLGELKEKKHLSKLVGERYSLALIHAEGGEPWYLEQFPLQERIFHYNDFSGGKTRSWFGVEGQAMGPGEQLRLIPDDLPVISGASRCRFRLRFLINGDPEKEMQTRGVPRFLMFLNGTPVWINHRFTTFHDVASQFMEEVFFTPEAPEKLHEVLLVNQDTSLTVLIPLLGIRREPIPPLEITGCPRWVLTGEAFALTIKVNSSAALIHIEYDPELLEPALPGGAASNHPLKQDIAGLNRLGVNEAALRCLSRGEHSFYFKPRKGGVTISVTFTDQWTNNRVTADIPFVYDVPGEEQHCLTGAELRMGNPDDYLDLLKRFRDERIADLAVYRDYHNDSGNSAKLWEAAAFCRENNIAVDAIIMDEQTVVAKAAAEKCLCVGTHEHTGIFYGRDPVLDCGYTMKEAAAAAVEKLRQVAETFRIEGVSVAVGDASGGSRYAYMAGFDIIRHETFVGHHMLILPNARGAARAFNKSIWGVHMATQHNNHPELEYG